MKKAFLLVFCQMCVALGVNQVKAVEVSHYLFPEFIKGLVLMKSGVKSEAFLNYNTITEEMIFDTRGVKQALDKTDLIDTVFIEGNKFISLDKKFVEDICLGKYELYVEHKCRIADVGKPTAYGGTTQTSATSVYSSYFANGRLYQMVLPEGLETKPYNEYWLKKDGKAVKFLNIRQLSKMFEDKSDLFKDYINKYKVKYTDQKSIIDLIKYMESI